MDYVGTVYRGQKHRHREGKGLSTKEQQYDPTSIINEVRGHVDAWAFFAQS
jgi:hypothetical protein